MSAIPGLSIEDASAIPNPFTDILKTNIRVSFPVHLSVETSTDFRCVSIRLTQLSSTVT